MPAIVWSDEYSVRIPEIDRQHQVLVELLNQLGEGIDSGKNAEVVATCLKSLLDYSRTHFSSEEQLLRKYRYPELSSHIEEHDGFILEIVDFQRKARKGDLELMAPMMAFLKEWLLKHIMGTDRTYSEFLLSKMRAR